jgi:hypothetical protein
MKPLVAALQAILGTALLVGCAAPGPQQPEVKPVIAVRDGGAKAGDYFQLARYYQSKGRYRDATEAYRRALRLDDRMAEAHSALGAILALNHNFDAAFDELTRAIDLEPTTARFRNNLGYAYYLKGDAAKAVAVFEAAAALEPDNPRTWNNLGLALAQLGERERSAAAFARGTALASGGAAGAPAVPAAVPASPVDSAALTPTPRGATAPVAPPTPEGAALPAHALAGNALALEPSAALLAALAVPMAPSSAPLLQRIDPVPFGEVDARASPTTAVIEVPDTSVAAIDFATLRVPAEMPAPLALVPLNAVQVLEPIPPSAVAAVGEIAMPEIPLQPSPVDAPPIVAAAAPTSEAIGVAEVPTIPSSTGTVIAQVPTAATIVEVAPNAVELKWTSSTVVMRPATVEVTPATATYRLEVANGNGVTGMAKRVGTLFVAIGVPKARLTNQKPFVQPSTEVQYRKGYHHQAAALSARLPGRPVTVETADLRAGTDVRVVLGKDLPMRVALVDPAADARRASARPGAATAIE